MERTSNKISEDCDQLLNDSESFLASNINKGYNKNNSSDDEEDNIELRHKNLDFASSTKRYAEVSQSYPDPNNITKRFSDLKLEAFSNIRLYGADDERQSLIQEEALPETSGNDLDQSRNSTTLTDTGALAEDECTSSGSDASETSSNRLCDISILERLLRTHSLWFIPGIQRSGAVHLLQGKEVGVSFFYCFKYFPYNKIYFTRTSLYEDQASKTQWRFQLDWMLVRILSTT